MIQASEWIVAGLLRASAGLSIAAVLVAGCVRLLRLRAPRAEQWAWMIVLAQGVVLVPVAIPVPWGPSPAPRPEPTALPSPGSPRVSGEAEREKAGRDVRNEPAVPTAPVGESPSERAATARRSWDEVSLSWPFVGLSAWLAGIGALLIVGALRHRSFAERSCGARPAEPEWQAQWRRVLDERGIRASIPLLVSGETGPVLCWTGAGYRLVVPESLWAGLSVDERSAILRHEREHYRRGDLWTALLVRGLAVLHRFNPLARWAAVRFEAQSDFRQNRPPRIGSA